MVVAETTLRPRVRLSPACRELQSMELFDNTKIAATRFHFVFVLDESSSMSGRPWQDLSNAYYALLARREGDQSQGDFVSVATFSTS